MEFESKKPDPKAMFDSQKIWGKIQGKENTKEKYKERKSKEK